MLITRADNANDQYFVATISTILSQLLVKRSVYGSSGISQRQRSSRPGLCLPSKNGNSALSRPTLLSSQAASRDSPRLFVAAANLFWSSRGGSQLRRKIPLAAIIPLNTLNLEEPTHDCHATRLRVNGVQ